MISAGNRGRGSENDGFSSGQSRSAQLNLTIPAGWVWPQSFSGIGEFKSNQIIGVRGGFFVTSGLEIGGNYYYNNHFQPRASNEFSTLAGDLGFSQPGVRGNLGELEFTYHFGKRSLFGSTGFRPYVVAGVGGLVTSINNGNDFVLNTRSIFIPGPTPAVLVGNPQNTILRNVNLQGVLVGANTTKGVAFVSTPTGTNVFVANDVLDGGTFFTFSYGVGLKATRVWGPVGFFGDFRGRTVPNFFGQSSTWPEVNAGLNFSWGEK